ncbi:MAG: hypothetical protein KDI56_09215, partial [Xanthomonadales bacterium]|nr:hypothetical protein [Xanthomonadales bacterium]
QFDPGTNRWLLETVLPNPDATPDADFGAAVAVAGDWILIGAPSSNGFDGRAYLFQRNDLGQWQPTLRLSSSAVGGHMFGQSVAFARDGSFVVGAPNFAGGDGAFYVFLSDELLQDGFE